MVGLVGMVLMITGGYLLWPKKWFDPRGNKVVVQVKNLEKYDFDSLRKRGGIASEIQILGPITPVADRRKAAKKVYTSEFTTREISFVSNGKKISGMINYYPEKSSLSKVIIMIRGYADKPGYYPGSGTWAAADKLADANYATISLDFLGYGNSEAESEDMLEARFEKVVSVLDLLESVKQLPWVDKDRIGIWAHSNGGQIALSVLEVTGGKYPTVLWAPMTQKFPESVLSTIDADSPVKAAMAEFEKYYDVRRYAFENYYQWIRAPILIQQGTADEWCRVEWQTGVTEKIKSFGGKAELIIYQGDDHNLKKNWEAAVERDVEYFEMWM